MATTGAAPLLFLGEDDAGQRGDQDEQKDTAEDNRGHDGALWGLGMISGCQQLPKKTVAHHGGCVP